MRQNRKIMSLIDRFFRYTSFETTSDNKTGTTPSTHTQKIFADYLAGELKTIGLTEVTVDKNAYVMATLPANIDKNIPVIGFISHMDTSPDMTAKQVHPRIESNYSGGDILLNKKENIRLSPTDFPELLNYIGQDIVVTDGKTLLGADDKAGIAEIVTAMEYLIQHPEIPHGKVRIAFTPDEEIGQGAHHFDVKAFGAEWAYTVDGGEIGELEYENFNAAVLDIRFIGRNVHPGYAKGKMINALLLANEFISLLPTNETPQKTEGYEGFFHVTNMSGTVEEATLSLIIRDHNRQQFEEKKQRLVSYIESMDEKYVRKCSEYTLKDQYYNMREKVEPVKYIVDIAEKAMITAGVKPKIKAIRGGTDGSQLSYMGLPCPNIFAGGHNFHGRYEFVPVQSMEKAVEVIVNIITLTTNH